MKESPDWFWWIAGCLGMLVALLCLALASGVAYVYFTGETVSLPQPALTIPTPPTAVEIAPLPPDLAPTVTLSTDVATVIGVTPIPTVNNLPVLSGSAAVEVGRASGNIQVDGQLNEWGAAPAIPLEHRVFARSSWDGTNDLTAAYRLLWDDTYLYVAVEIQDDTHFQNESGRTSYQGDSLEMQFDTERAADYGRSLSPDDFQLVLSPGNFSTLSPEAYRFRGTTGGQMDDFVGHQIAVGAAQTADGYTLEARIPWRDLSLTPPAGLQIGACLNANDNDLGDSAGQEIMLSNVSTRTFRDPTTWGTIVLK